MSDERKSVPTGSETRTEYLARKMGELASAVRESANQLPDVPISGEVVAAAGIYATANLLDEVRAALAGSGDQAMMDEMIDSTYADLWPDSGVALRINRLAAITMELRRLRVLASAPPEAEKGQESVQKALNLAMVALHKIAYGRARYTGSRTAMEALQQITEVTSGAPPEASEEPEKDHDE